MRKIIIIYSALILFGLAILAAVLIPWGEEVDTTPDSGEIESFADCVAAGFPIMESYPRQCRNSDGETFVEDIGDELDKVDLVQVASPRPNESISSPLEITGEARGTWFFEADFPVELLDGNGDPVPLDPPYIMTSEDWMTEDFVSFSSTHTFEMPETQTGTLILHKDNPSGLPENDDSFRIPVRFLPAESVDDGNDEVVLEECVPAGCSGQVCAEASEAPDIITTCEWRSEYECLALTTCERQPDGECGWTPNQEFDSCMADVGDMN